MKFKKYCSHEEAIQDLEQMGELKYFGREGLDANGYVYQFIRDGLTHIIVVYKDGNVIWVK